MPALSDERFTFVSRALADDAFGVVDFQGTEGLNRCYEFEINLVSETTDVNLEQVLEKPAVFTIRRPEGDIPFHGIPAGFEQRQAFGEYVFYRAVLRPKLWWLTLTHHNQVFLKKTIPEILEAVLKDGGLTSLDFELRLQKDYPQWEYVCQYRESHFDFVSRWMERDGIYYYFEQTDNGEKVILTDTHLAHKDMPQGQTVYYSPPSGLDAGYAEEVVKSFVCRQRMLPKEVHLKDYNYRTPSLEISGQARVKANGRGEVFIYGEHFRTPEEGNDLAAIRAEELLCREKEFVGDSIVPFLRPGYTFKVEDHYRDSYNQKYLTVDLHHQGSQAAYLTAGLQQALSEREEQAYYRNSFTAIPAGVQFRPERQTEKAHFYGTMNAKIDAAGSGLYAELDDQGRYKVILPFDLSGRKDGKASAWLRMMQPYGGSNHGMHFPLHKETEVLLTFIDGDPDRPIIAGAVPNPDHPSIVTDDNQTKSMITTSGQNKIHIEDQEGNQRILLHSPTENSFIRLGSHNDPPSFGSAMGDFYNGINISTDKRLSVYAGLKNSTILGENSVNTGGVDSKLVVGERFDTTLGHRLNLALLTQTDVKMGWHWNWRNTMTEMEGTRQRVVAQTVTVEAARQAVRAELTRLEGNVNHVIGQADQVRGQVNTAAGAANIVRGQLEDVVGDANTARGQLNTVVGEANTVHGDLNRVVGQATRVRGQLNEVVGEANQIAGEITEAAATIDSVAAEVFRIHAIDSTV